jgi:hypothetical protein
MDSLTESCDHAGDTGRNLFCARCGKVKEPGSLKRVRLMGFTGPASLSPAIEHFWETGEVEHL